MWLRVRESDGTIHFIHISHVAVDKDGNITVNFETSFPASRVDSATVISDRSAFALLDDLLWTRLRAAKADGTQ